MMNRQPEVYRRLLLTLALLVIPLLMLTSCGDDDDDMLVSYYMSIDSSVGYSASSEDEQQGTMSENSSGNVLYTTITRMKRALRNAYPIADYQGNDPAVLTACDNIYREYKNMYGAHEKNTVCVVKILRTHIDNDGIVRDSRTLTVYHFGALPPSLDSPE